MNTNEKIQAYLFYEGVDLSVEVSRRSVARALPLLVTIGNSRARFAQFCKGRDMRYGRLW
jgi:hypothetical protein